VKNAFNGFNEELFFQQKFSMLTNTMQNF